MRLEYGAGERDKVRGTVIRKERGGLRRKERGSGERAESTGGEETGDIKNGENAVGGDEEKRYGAGEKQKD